MKISIRRLKSLLRESIFNEGDADEQVTGDSLDSQVDRYLGDYESEAKSSKNEGLDFHRMTRRFLTEAGDEGDDVKKDAPEDVPADDTGGKMTEDDIDVESFVNSVVRLIENYDSLLEVRSTLVRRAKNFLTKQYDESVVKQFEDVLREQHGIEDGKSKDDVRDEEFPAPAADRAGDGGSGGGAA